MLVELLSGQRLLQGFSLGSMLKAHIAGPKRDGVPVGWKPLCTSLLMFSADDRLSSFTTCTKSRIRLSVAPRRWPSVLPEHARERPGVRDHGLEDRLGAVV
ncbi:MAG: hypothetical protein ACI8RZ_000533 [Myxococcota bacterium]|jgi:hypothetical protein